MVIKEVLVKGALTKSGIFSMGYSLNPYIGCSHRCLYCYADFIGKWRDVLPWGEVIEVKINLPERLRSEVKRKKRGVVVLGTVCDPYQPIEEKYQLTEEALAILTFAKFPFRILTKSSLCLRDIELLKGAKEKVGFDGVVVEMTLTTLDEGQRRIFEPFASSVEERISVLRRLKKEGIKTVLFFGPVLPYFSDREEMIRDIFSLAAAVGVEEVLVDRFNYLDKKIGTLLPNLKNFPEAQDYYGWVNQNYLFYTEELRKKVERIAQDFSLPISLLF